jgi:small ligand-binding sensory domain FIST
MRDGVQWVVFEAFYLDFVRRASRTWVKTQRFASAAKEVARPVTAEEPSALSAPMQKVS